MTNWTILTKTRKQLFTQNELGHQKQLEAQQNAEKEKRAEDAIIHQFRTANR